MFAGYYLGVVAWDSESDNLTELKERHFISCSNHQPLASVCIDGMSPEESFVQQYGETHNFPWR